MLNIMVTTAKNRGHMVPVEQFLKGDLSSFEYENVETYDYIYYKETDSIRNLYGDEVSKEELEQALLIDNEDEDWI